MNILCNLMLGFLMLAIALIVYDYGRIWWLARRHGYILADRNYRDPPWRWQKSYYGYKTWTWVVRIFIWLAVCWHLVLAYSWFSDALFGVAT